MWHASVGEADALHFLAKACLETEGTFFRFASGVCSELLGALRSSYIPTVRLGRGNVLLTLDSTSFAASHCFTCKSYGFVEYRRLAMFRLTSMLLSATGTPACERVAVNETMLCSMGLFGSL